LNHYEPSVSYLYDKVLANVLSLVRLQLGHLMPLPEGYTVAGVFGAHEVMAEPREMGVTLCIGRCLELREKVLHSLIALAECKESICLPSHRGIARDECGVI
jgi:hypothetical protein